MNGEFNGNEIAGYSGTETGLVEKKMENVVMHMGTAAADTRAAATVLDGSRLDDLVVRHRRQRQHALVLALVALAILAALVAL